MNAPEPAGESHRPLSVSALTSHLKGVVEGAFAKVRVEGEISNARAAASGHVYFTLKDAGASLSAVIWASTARKLSGSVVDGKKMTAYGDVQVYAPHGKYQLIVRSIQEVGLGERLVELEALRRKLAQEGLFDPARKQTLPLLPRRVGVVTSETGDALRDILTTLNRRFPTRALIASARVQGQGASQEIAEAIAALDAHPEVDVIIVGRGGGSIEDLWAFNEEIVARAISEATTPIVSAVGHEPDHLLSDDVADLRAPTPTAAAERVVPSRDDLLAGIDARAQALVRAAEARLRVARTQIEGAERALRVAGPDGLRAARSRHGELIARLRNLHPRQRLATERGAVDGLRRRLIGAGQNALRGRRHRVERLARALEVLSPVACLERGYAIVRDDAGSVVSDAASVNPGASVKLLLHRGALHATVNQIDTRHELEGEGR